MNCERCGEMISGDFGSGRFCSKGCANSRGPRTKEFKEKVSAKLKGKVCGENRITGNNWDNTTVEKVKASWNKKLLEANFNELGWHSKRKRVILEQNNTCNKCGLTEWLEQPITLEIDHIDGINDNDSRDNLEGICPNCHSVTETWRGRNKPAKIGRNKVTDFDLLNAIKETDNIRQALLLVGLSAKGNNYKRAKQLKESMGS